MRRRRSRSSESPRRHSPHISRSSFAHNPTVLAPPTKGIRRNRTQLALQHTWLMVILPRSRKVHHGTPGRRGSRQGKNESTHPPTQLWQPVSPHEECLPKGVHRRSRSTSANESRPSRLAFPPRGRTQSHGGGFVASVNKCKHLSSHPVAPPHGAPPTPTRSDLLVPPTAGVTPQPPPPQVLAPTSSNGTSMDAHRVPTMIRVPSRGNLALGGQNTTDMSIADMQSPLDDDDVHSEVSLDHALFVTQVRHDSSDDSYAAGSHAFDHPLFQEAGDLSELYPPLSKFHNSVTTHDSTWGITTATLDDDWPSDEDKSPTKQRGRSRTMDSTLTRENEADTTAWGHLSCGDLQFCSTERVGGGFFNPVFPGKKILRSSTTPDTVATTTTRASRDDEVCEQRVNRRAALCKRESYGNSESWGYEEFHLSHTCTTESASSWMADLL